jgi:hypothetical protein
MAPEQLTSTGRFALNSAEASLEGTVDDHFDQLARGMASGLPRRELLRRLAIGLGAGAMALLRPIPVEAAAPCTPCAPNGLCCKSHEVCCPSGIFPQTYSCRPAHQGCPGGN